MATTVGPDVTVLGAELGEPLDGEPLDGEPRAADGDGDGDASGLLVAALVQPPRSAAMTNGRAKLARGMRCLREPCWRGRCHAAVTT